jgi:hypothetical protein
MNGDAHSGCRGLFVDATIAVAVTASRCFVGVLEQRDRAARMPKVIATVTEAIHTVAQRGR